MRLFRIFCTTPWPINFLARLLGQSSSLYYFKYKRNYFFLQTMVQSTVVFAFLVCAVASASAVENPVRAYVTSTSKSARVEVFFFFSEMLHFLLFLLKLIGLGSPRKTELLSCSSKFAKTVQKFYRVHWNMLSDLSFFRF